MTSASMTFGRPTRLAVPRGAILLGTLAAALIGGLRRLDHWQLKQLRNEPKTADGLLDWANQIEASEPGFASEIGRASCRERV